MQIKRSCTSKKIINSVNMCIFTENYPSEGLAYVVLAKLGCVTKCLGGNWFGGLGGVGGMLFILASVWVLRTQNARKTLFFSGNKTLYCIKPR